MVEWMRMVGIICLKEGDVECFHTLRCVGNPEP